MFDPVRCGNSSISTAYEIVHHLPQAFMPKKFAFLAFTLQQFLQLSAAILTTVRHTDEPNLSRSLHRLIRRYCIIH
ncbi:hypothetical protein J6590_017061 [Homalodisca vitripennis]|nr:hypothetical protein J6590_017061 [Homalodisca vitripennis]